MGCDIHCYVEYRSKDRTDAYSDQWDSFGGRINPGRCYGLFTRLAGVRGNVADAIVPPRGCPADMGFRASGDNRLYLRDDETDDEGCVEKATADCWVKNGVSQYINGNDGKPLAVTNPDWHSHSWLTPDEFAKVLDLDDVKQASWLVEYRALLAAMRQFESEGFASRIVFWFDN